MRYFLLSVSLGSLGFLVGCASDANAPGIGSIEQAGVSLNGVSLNGVSLNGVSLNGVSLNGVSLNGVSLNGTVLAGVTAGGQTVSGTDLVGSQWVGQLSDGSTITLRIDGVTAGSGANADVLSYDVAYQTSAGWSALCGGNAAIPVSGLFDYRSGVPGGGGFTASSASFTFGCRGAAIAKCVELGYKPWLTIAGVGLGNHMVACTRLLRADFCGDGATYTVDGTEVDLYDGLGVQSDTQSWNAEAEWTQDGARCVAPGTPSRVQQKVHRVPPCFAHDIDHRCAAPPAFATGTLLASETARP